MEATRGLKQEDAIQSIQNLTTNIPFEALGCVMGGHFSPSMPGKQKPSDLSC